MVYQSESPNFRLKFNTEKTHMCGPLVMDDELPRAVPYKNTDDEPTLQSMS